MCTAEKIRINIITCVKKIFKQQFPEEDQSKSKIGSIIGSSNKNSILNLFNRFKVSLSRYHQRRREKKPQVCILEKSYLGVGSIIFCL